MQGVKIPCKPLLFAHRHQGEQIMENLIGYIAKSLVDDPAQVKVSRRIASGTTIIELHVAQEDTGRVIGKGPCSKCHACLATRVG